MNNTVIDHRPAVLLVVPLPPPYAGPEIATESLLNSGLRDRFRLLVAPVRSQVRNRDRGSIGLKQVSRLIALCGRMVLFIIRHRCRVVYIYISQSRLGLIRDAALFFTAKLFRCRVVWHFRGGNLDVFYRNSGSAMRWLVRYVLNHAQALILLGPSIRPRLRRIGLRLPIYIVPNWAPLPPWSNDRELLLPVTRSAAPVTFLALGSISVAKGSVHLLRAADRILSQGRDARFVFAGEVLPREHNILRDEAGTPIPSDSIEQVISEVGQRYPGNVRFLGLVGPETKWRLLREANVLVLPSYSEGFPMSFLEGMAAGLPIVGTPVGAIPDFLREGEHVRFVRPGDEDGLTKILLEMMESEEERSRIGANNYRYVRETLNLENASSLIGDVFSRVLNMPSKDGAKPHKCTDTANQNSEQAFLKVR